jgi:PIN domain nuclease of toxin-antitoxin system
MRTRVPVFILVVLLFLAAAGRSTAIEQDQLRDQSRFSKDKSLASGAVATDPKAIAKLIDEINAAARTNKQRMMSIIVINIDVAAATLEKEKAQTGMSLGEIYVAHSLALATNKKFSAILALKKSGKSWAEIATAHKVSLKGSNELIKEMQKQ